MLTCLLVVVAAALAGTVGVFVLLAIAPRRLVQDHIERMVAGGQPSPFLDTFAVADPGTPVSVSGRGPWVEGVRMFQLLESDAVGPLADALSDERAPARLAALTGIMAIAPVATDALPAVERAATHTDPTTRQYALRALVRLGSSWERLRPTAVAALEDPVPSVSLTAAQLLRQREPGSPTLEAWLDRALDPLLRQALSSLARVGLLEGQDAASVRAAAQGLELDLLHLLDRLQSYPATARTMLVVYMDPNALSNPAGPDVVASWTPPRGRALGLRGTWERETRRARIVRGDEILAEGIAPDVYAARGVWNAALAPFGVTMLSLDGGTDDAFFLTVPREAAETIRTNGLLNIEARVVGRVCNSIRRRAGSAIGTRRRPRR